MVKERAKAAAEPASISSGAVTGVASGGLGTAANLEDTQLWDLEDLRAAPDDGLDSYASADDFADDVPDVPPEPAPMSAPPPPMAAVPVARQAARPLPAAQPLPAAVVAAPRGQRRTGVIAAAAVGLLALAAMLALRDGLPGGASRGAGDAAGAFPSLPPAASIAPQATAAPDAGGGGGGGGGGNGHGNNGGKGNGNGHGNN